MNIKKLQEKSSILIYCLFILSSPVIATDIVFESSFEDPPSDCGPPPNIHPGANLRGCDLSGIDLSGADLSGANLSGAILTDADLTGTILNDADLTLVTWSNTTCPDGTNSDDNAGTCVGHFTNTPPEITSVILSPSIAFKGSTLICTPSAFDADEDNVSFIYSWRVNGAPLPNATTSTLTGVNFSRGDSVQCRATAWDGFDNSAPVDSNLVTISNTAPVIGSVVVTPDPARTNSTLSCSVTAVVDMDGDVFSLTFAWLVNGSLLPTAITNTLGSVNFSRGDSVQCRATAWDGFDFSDPADSNLLTIENSPPVISSVTLSPNPAYEESTLTCSPVASDLDGDSVTFDYSWWVNGLQVSTANTLTGANFDASDNVQCRLTAWDGIDFSTPVSSINLTISSSPP